MKTCFLNPPYQTRIMRRYSCTYHAPNFLFPPLELMYLAAIVKEFKKGECIIIDAVAEGLNLDKSVERIRRWGIDLLVVMPGIESFDEDIRTIRAIKTFFPGLKIACLGYLSSQFPYKTMEENPAVDYIIMDEPELSFSRLYDCLLDKENLSDDAAGIAYRENGKIFIGPKRERIKDLDALPYPARGLIQRELYNEFLLGRPFTTILSSRGCSFECGFCVSTYGRQVVYRSVENVLAEIEEVIGRHKVRAMRFMDDTFSLDKVRLMRICDGIVRKRLRFDWSCLSRVDTLDEEMLVMMKKSGCQRVYLGIETFSQRLLDYYRKGYDAVSIRPRVKMIKKNKIEAVGFFIVGGIQTEDEFRNDVFLAKQVELDYVVVEKLTPYSGTPVFINIKNSCEEEKALRWEKEFYRAFYLRPGYLFSRIKSVVFNLEDTVSGWKSLRGYLTKVQNTPVRPELI